MTTHGLLTALVLVPVLACACDSREREKEKASARPPSGTDGDAAATTASVFLRGHIEGERAVMEVVARGASRDVHGAAFRLRWTPDELTFVKARASDAWSGSAIRLAKEGRPGELVVVWTEKGGATGVHASDETILGTIELAVKTRGAFDVGFRPERSTLRDASGAPIAVEWHGWQIAGP